MIMLCDMLFNKNVFFITIKIIILIVLVKPLLLPLFVVPVNVIVIVM